MGAALFGYSSPYGQVPGAQGDHLRVPHAQYTHISVPHGPPDDRFAYLFDVLPTAKQAVAYADSAKDRTLLVLGPGPIGDMCCRVARQWGVRQVIGVDNVPGRLALVRDRGRTSSTSGRSTTSPPRVLDLAHGRGADTLIDVVGMEAHGSPVAKVAGQGVSLTPSALAAPLMRRAGVDRLAAFTTAIDAARRGGTILLVGV